MSGRVEENLRAKAGKNTTKWGRNISMERSVGGKSQEKYQAVGGYTHHLVHLSTPTHTHTYKILLALEQKVLFVSCIFILGIRS